MFNLTLPLPVCSNTARSVRPVNGLAVYSQNVFNRPPTHTILEENTHAYWHTFTVCVVPYLQHQQEKMCVKIERDKWSYTWWKKVEI